MGRQKDIAKFQRVKNNYLSAFLIYFNDAGRTHAKLTGMAGHTHTHTLREGEDRRKEGKIGKQTKQKTGTKNNGKNNANLVVLNT